jgi:23S rRNA (adenine2503-C2)-methyltransferase
MNKKQSIFEVKVLESKDTRVKKFVFTSDSAVAEAVLYKYPEYKDRTVICCSVQSGCAVGCTFCGTGKQFIRNLTTDEIIFQVNKCLEETNVIPSGIKKLQIMFMSMGEPFHNYSNLEKAIVSLHELYPNAALLVSTSAPRGNIRAKHSFIKLASEINLIGLQFSVHESSDENRRKLIPTPTLDLDEIKYWGEEFLKTTGRRPFFNYCVHTNNSSQQDVLNLLEIFNPNFWECTLSVICNADETIHESKVRQLDLIQSFSGKMLNAGYSLRVFDPAGQDDIGGGCGQLWATQKWINNKNKQK